jgi:hypothetical protein
MIKPMDKVSTLSLTELNMLGNGKTITKTGKEFNSGQTERIMKGNIRMELRLAKAYLNFQTAVTIRENFSTIRFMGKVHIIVFRSLCLV